MQFFPQMAPYFLCHHDSPSNMAKFVTLVPAAIYTNLFPAVKSDSESRKFPSWHHVLLTGSDLQDSRSCTDAKAVQIFKRHQRQFTRLSYYVQYFFALFQIVSQSRNIVRSKRKRSGQKGVMLTEAITLYHAHDLHLTQLSLLKRQIFHVYESWGAL